MNQDATNKQNLPDSFTSLGLSEAICRAVKDDGYTKPTPIQAQAIPPILAGRDLLGCAQTGTGKTAAFSLPILHLLTANDTGPRPVHQRGVRALVLTPTRELAHQIAENVQSYGRYLRIRSVMAYGGVSIETQKRNIRQGADILIATPGRLLDLCNQKAVELRQVEIFVLDEADRMLDMGFIHDVRKIMKLLPRERQNLLFSATMPKDIEDLTHTLLQKPARVEVAPVASTNAQIEQQVYYVDQPHKRFLLLHILKDPAVSRVLIFARTKHSANKLAAFLTENKHRSEAIHGNRTQSQRQRALDDFRRGSVKVLVASDLASRGIDIDNISHVVNYDMPNVPETYVHRIGRTGRAAQVGIAISLCSRDERSYMRNIERLIKKPVRVMANPADIPEPAPGEGTPPESTFGRQAQNRRSQRPGSDRGGRSSHGGGGRGGPRRDSGGRDDRPQRGGPQRDREERGAAHPPRGDGSRGRSSQGGNDRPHRGGNDRPHRGGGSAPQRPEHKIIRHRNEN